ncbi:phage major capsid protein [Sansalvadorimonas verongulae]|uniref:phage major capsid protein n=1 Tax=Sansalvadorimonas verongulae TaxID=2172824 RepID=UPI0012BC3B4C|nr:phage major capsid protein [Sansalvadorimonas verongulae]MTI12791.1 phage major capsid protein [Sansalvadorimonas verongulae]
MTTTNTTKKPASNIAQLIMEVATESKNIDQYGERQGKGVRLDLNGQRTLTTTSSNGVLVPQQLKNDSYIGIAREKSAILQAGAQVVTGFQADVTIPKMSKNVVNKWLGEDEDRPESDPEFELLNVTQKTLGSQVILSRRLHLMTGGGIDKYIEDELSESVASGVDHAAIQGSGNNFQPQGILFNTNIPKGETKASGQWDRESINAAVANIRNAEHSGEISVVCSPTTCEHMQNTYINSRGDDALLQWRDGALRFPNGVKCVSTKKIPNDQVIIGAFENLIIAEFATSELEKSGVGLESKGSVAVRVFTDCDITVKYADAFYILTLKA